MPLPQQNELKPWWVCKHVHPAYTGYNIRQFRHHQNGYRPLPLFSPLNNQHDQSSCARAAAPPGLQPIHVVSTFNVWMRINNLNNVETKPIQALIHIKAHTVYHLVITVVLIPVQEQFFQTCSICSQVFHINIFIKTWMVGSREKLQNTTGTHQQHPT